ncbi:MAG: NAD-dependent epimerase/dehydratase family protein, partial [Lachnospiraceae bacterium]|nr:NAD-dependent epimerase/dehydratase family protein [Lachnospiraceae bacterium]
MKILVTGAHGFIGKNLVRRLKNIGYTDIMEFTRENTEDELKAFCSEADFVFHLAGVNRPENDDEFRTGNTDLTKQLSTLLVN